MAVRRCGSVRVFLGFVYAVQALTGHGQQPGHPVMISACKGLVQAKGYDLLIEQESNDLEIISLLPLAEILFEQILLCTLAGITANNRRNPV